MTHSKLTDEEFAALDEAAWNALGGRCVCSSNDPPCSRDIDQMDLLAEILGTMLEGGRPMIEEWKANRALRIEFPFLFQAKWPEGEP